MMIHATRKMNRRTFYFLSWLVWTFLIEMWVLYGSYEVLNIRRFWMIWVISICKMCTFGFIAVNFKTKRRGSAILVCLKEVCNVRDRRTSDNISHECTLLNCTVSDRNLWTLDVAALSSVAGSLTFVLFGHFTGDILKPGEEAHTYMLPLQVHNLCALIWVGGFLFRWRTWHMHERASKSNSNNDDDDAQLV